MTTKRIACLLASLMLLCMAMLAQPQATAEEKALAQRVYQAQERGDETAFHAAQKEFMDYELKQKNWSRYYNLWVNEVVFYVNSKQFYKAFTEIKEMTDDIEERKLQKYLYVSYQALGLYYVNRNNYEQGESYFKKAIELVDTTENQLAAANLHIALAQAQSYTNPHEAMRQLDRLPPLKGNPTTESGVLAYRCIIAYEMGDIKAFRRYYNQYDSIRRNFPEPFNEVNYENVMVYYHLSEGRTDQALAWCDSLDSEIETAELRWKVYQHTQQWEKALLELERKDSLERLLENDIMREDLSQLTHTIDDMGEYEHKARIRKAQVTFVIVLALIITALLVTILIYRNKSHRRLKEQLAQTRAAQEQTAKAMAIRTAFVNSIRERLKSPIQVLFGYARIFNDPDFRMEVSKRPKAFQDIVDSAKAISSFIEPVIESMTHNDNTAISQQQKTVCQDALRSPLSSLIGIAEILAEDKSNIIPEDDYLKMREEVSNDAYMVSTSTQELIMYSMMADVHKTELKDCIGLNEAARETIHGYDLRNRNLEISFKTDIDDAVHIRTDSELIHVLLVCLLRNADKFATIGKVELSCHTEADGTYSIAVSNEGDSIPEGCDEERFLTPFVRVRPSSHGLGLRLSLARQIARSMNYELHLDMSYTKGVRIVLSGLKEESQTN